MNQPTGAGRMKIREKNFFQRGMTLVELQMSAVMFVLVMLAGGVVFYFSLAALRYLQDVYQVNANVTAAMTALHQEILRANRYGWRQGTSYSPSPNSTFDLNGWIAPSGADEYSTLNAIPSLAGSVGSSDVLILRQEQNPETRFNSDGSVTTPMMTYPEYYSDDQITSIYRDEPAADLEGRADMWMDVVLSPNFVTTSGTGTHLIARNITRLEFAKISYNCLQVEVEAMGTVPKPIRNATDDPYYRVKILTYMTLRCAPQFVREATVGDLW